jgi:glycosyltransferase involved in cell wall biosynthesis
VTEDAKLKRSPHTTIAAKALPESKDVKVAEKSPADGEPGETITGILGELGALRQKAVELQNELAAARSRPLKVVGDYAKYWFLQRLSRFSPPLPPAMAARFARSSAKRHPLRSLPAQQQRLNEVLEEEAKASRSSRLIRSARLTASVPTETFDATKRTVVVVSHEASRTGAPILALNLVQKLARKYNVVSIVLGGGALLNNFQAASVAVYQLKRWDTRRVTDAAIAEICRVHDVVYAIVNSAESRNVLPGLKECGVPVVTLLHEFAAYTKPKTSFSGIFDNSDQVIFSTRITLENALEILEITRGSMIHVLPQGKCIVPPGGDDKDDTHERMWLRGILRPSDVSEREFVVLGAGTIEPRKAVDLFIECATRVINGPGGKRFRFVWIGSGFDPENGGNISVYLADQVARAGIRAQIDFVRPTSAIEYAYELCDALLLSARLDPLPNVAIDAITLGKPVLCFERTTGIADFLVDAGLGESCVAQYLDTRDLAEKLRALALDEALRTSVSAKAREAGNRVFDFDRYVERLDEIATRVVPADRQIADDGAVISASGRFRRDFCVPAEDAALEDKDAIGAFLKAVRSGRGMRKPMPGFNPAIYRLHHDDDFGADPFAAFLRGREPAGPWLRPVIDDRAVTTVPSGNPPRAALHLHVSDPGAVADVARRLGFNSTRPDLFVSTVAGMSADVRTALEAAALPVKLFETVPVHGRALGALLTGFAARLTEGYDLIGHLEVGGQLRHSATRSAAILENMIGGEIGGAMLDRVLAAVADDPTIGLVHPDDPNVCAWGAFRPAAEEFARRMMLNGLPEQFDFPTARAFWCRSEVLAPFVTAGLGWDDYPTRSDDERDTTFDALARLVGVVPDMIGRRIAVTNLPNISW